MKTRLALAAFSIAAGSLVSGQAQAALITDDITFSATDFTAFAGGPPPVDPVTGSFRITFDPTLTYTDETNGITLNTLNIALGSALSFSYDPTDPNHWLIIGGISSGAGVVSFNPSSNDFWLHIANFTTTPVFQQLGYSQTSVGPQSLYFTTDATGSVSVTPFVPTTSGVPEPATWTMMILGFGLIGGAMRRQTSQAVRFRFA